MRIIPVTASTVNTQFLPKTPSLNLAAKCADLGASTTLLKKTTLIKRAELINPC
jgi:hypothetical protein